MNSSAEHRICPGCGATIPANAPQGICPKCLMAAAAVTTDAGQTGGQRPEPPSLERLAAAFPQLEVIELIGQGGMGAVYKARQKQLDRIVALKVLPPGIGGGPSFAERFTREAKALAKLLHPNIVALFEFGQADGIYYLLMEYVDGASLGQLLRSSRVSPREALAIVPQICDALQYAHDQGIVHRDIKPENILLDRRGRVKVADFGLAKLVGAEPITRPSDTLSSSDGERVGGDRPEALTAVGKIMGTPNYMAPEQVEHPGEVDHRADIYALGVVFYQMLTGELPGKRMEPPSRKVQIDVRLDEVVMRALERDPGRRYAQASVLKTEVETILNSGSAAASSSTPQKASWRIWFALLVVVPLALLLMAIAFLTRHTNTAGFGPVIERMVNLGFGTNCAIDLDSGRLMNGLDDVEKQGADAAGFGFLPISNPTLIGLCCINETFAMPVDSTNWDNSSAEWVRSRAEKLPLSVKASELPSVTISMTCSEDGALPSTYLFKTREGGRGILQITGFTETPPAVKIRYKLVLPQASPAPITSGRMLLPADRTQPSDEQIRNKIVGTWTCDWDHSRTVENKPDASYVCKFTINVTNEVTHEGTWRVEDGFIVMTMTNASWPDAMLEVESNKLVSIDDYKMVVLGSQGGTNVLTAHKR
jgi:predicted Ser/Thr protein kinase